MHSPTLSDCKGIIKLKNQKLTEIQVNSQDAVASNGLNTVPIL